MAHLKAIWAEEFMGGLVIYLLMLSRYFITDL